MRAEKAGMWSLRIGVALVLLMGQLGAQAPKAKAFDQFWPETDVFVRLNDSSRLFFLWAGTRTEEAGYTDGQAGAHVDLFLPPFLFKDRASKHPDIARNKFLTVRLGYLFGRTPGGYADPFTEHTPTAEANSRFFVGSLVLTNRNRGDFRFVNGVFTPRYRNRIKVEGTIPLGRLALTPYAHAEAFYDWRYNAFHRFRYTAGGELQLTGRIVIESYYLRQVDSRSEQRAENIAGLALQIYLR
jgi:hypothetical protein